MSVITIAVDTQRVAVRASTATKYCSYSQPSLPTPTIRMEVSRSGFTDYYKFYVSNFSSFPSGTSFSVSGYVELYIVGLAKSYTISAVTPTSSNGGLVGQVTHEIPTNYLSYSATVTASKSGYKSSTGSASG